MTISGIDSQKNSVTIFLISDDIESVLNKVATVFAQEGFMLSQGTPTQGTYSIGSAAWHALLGPFIRRRKINVTIVSNGSGNINLILSMGMSGWGGGLIGSHLHKTDFDNIVSQIKSRLS
jgi:hypothetical protein